MLSFRKNKTQFKTLPSLEGLKIDVVVAAAAAVAAVVVWTSYKCPKPWFIYRVFLIFNQIRPTRKQSKRGENKGT